MPALISRALILNLSGKANSAGAAPNNYAFDRDFVLIEGTLVFSLPTLKSKAL
jgi:hypothetical protein